MALNHYQIERNDLTMTQTTASDPKAVVERTFEAVNRHDLEAFLECFHLDYQSDAPPHPSRAFRGREIVRKNWAGIFADIPDIKVEVLRCVSDGDTVWAETRFFGTSREGRRFDLRGVIIHGVQASQIRWVRHYMEPVEGEAEPQ
jgi:ketosteroid isomerase-like protein